MKPSLRTVLAVGVWLALSHVRPTERPKLKQLCDNVESVAYRYVAAIAERSRQRLEVPEAEVEWPESAASADIEEAIKEALADTVKALRTNAVLDREEIDILWWTLGDRSSLLDRQFSLAPTVPAALAAAVELGRLLRRPPSVAHKHLVLRQVREDVQLTLAELLSNLEPVRAKFALPSGAQARATRCIQVFPLLSAIAGQQGVNQATDKSRLLSDWCARALAESAMLYLVGSPNPGV
ncbi:GTPase-associated system all-helical protein GASH [Burkholderia sp. MSMB0856]|uniref:GTPase-associated system all-helical protein GASH n=1 Tax=Burkholderia sp. MSMB0856 TaxID=1637869 RepID=UPI000ACBA161|nr:GTPase-associated system all-helical protein GASH [Burkholderia sp. MSMB0856]